MQEADDNQGYNVGLINTLWAQYCSTPTEPGCAAIPVVSSEPAPVRGVTATRTHTRQLTSSQQQSESHVPARCCCCSSRRGIPPPYSLRTKAAAAR